ncbi:MAG: glycerol-3-phosphate dehydrogenase/oxidase [Melioribacteraceae bacterium]|jgi:glycerol-3-phosphate dehydrogenase|nr:glycerol-3-phosphate dehydrogenase/oxidase [Melioribacteraceae bacterium]
MNRSEMIGRIDEKTIWDIIIIGGGATGVGIAVDAASRGYKTLLLEKGDFAQGTSSRSTKLVHGGVRYLQQGNISLVLEALKERGILRKNAPHLVHNLPFIVPNYDWWEGPFYGIGMKIYDMLAGKEGFGKSEIISKEETLKHIPTVEQEGLNGGVIYYDGQFDDARLVINIAKTATEQSATIINYMPVTKLIKKSGLLKRVIASDLESGKEYELEGKVLINATGPFTDSVRNMDDETCKPFIKPSQGVHIVLDKSFLPGDSAIMVPHTDDGRVIFAIPWHNKIIIGTTDTPMEKVELEPKPMEEEIDFLLKHTARYLAKDPTKKDVLSMFAGVRPLVNNPEAENTAAISREHVVSISKSGLVTIAGGKWTTYRKMAEDTLEQAIMVGGLEHKPCLTTNIQIHGFHKNATIFGELESYGSDATEIQNIVNKDSKLANKLHPEMTAIEAEVIWAVREEMVVNVEDFLSRRTRSLLLNAKASIEMAPKVAEIMKYELGKNNKWKRTQIESYSKLAQNYILS